MKRYIMIIDDSPTIRASVEIVIKSEGHNLEQAENGVDALAKVEKIRESGDEIALCICDINMPEMDGITFIREFRKIDKFTPVIVLTTESGKEKIQEGKESGASGWMIKPFRPKDLLDIVHKFVK